MTERLNFLEYEKSNNRLLHEIRHNRQFRDIKNLIIRKSRNAGSSSNSSSSSTSGGGDKDGGGIGVKNRNAMGGEKADGGGGGGGGGGSSGNAVADHVMMILCPHDQSVSTAMQMMRRKAKRQRRAENGGGSDGGATADTAVVAEENVENEEKQKKGEEGQSKWVVPHESMLEFVQSHVAYCNAQNPQEFICLNGVRGMFTDQFNEVYVLRGPIRGGDEAIQFFKDPLSLFHMEDSAFAKFEKSDEQYRVHLHSMQVLRISEMELEGTLVKLVLVSDPVKFDGCHWKMDEATTAKSPKTKEKSSIDQSTPSVSSPAKSVASSAPSRGFWSAMSSRSTLSLLSQSFSVSASHERMVQDELTDDEDEDEIHEHGNVDEEVEVHDNSNNNNSKMYNNDNGAGNGHDSDANGKTNDPNSKTGSASSGNGNADQATSSKDRHPEGRDEEKARRADAMATKNQHINSLINMHNISSHSLFPEQLAPRMPTRSHSSSTSSDQTHRDQQQQRPPPLQKTRKFSFQDFVEKMKHTSAIPLVRKIKKFIDEVNADPYDDDIPGRVLSFLGNIMFEVQTHPQWKNASDLETENARESLEKYVMTKIHHKVFSPDVEILQMDNNFASRLSSFRMLKPSNLEIDTAVIEDPSWNMAIEELKKINKYRAPRDKMICISNCCKILFDILERNYPKEAASADTFLPLLIYLVLKANPPHMHSNLKYIMDFRNPEKLISEAGYFFTNLQSSAVFWDNVDHTALSMEESEFDRIIGKKTVLFENEFEEENGHGEREESVVAQSHNEEYNVDKSAMSTSTSLQDDLTTISRSTSKESLRDQAPENSTLSTPREEHDEDDGEIVSQQKEKEKEKTEETIERDSMDQVQRRQIIEEFMSNVEEEWKRHSDTNVSDALVDIDDANSLRLGDIHELLRQYKIMHRFHVSVMKQYSNFVERSNICKD